MVVRPNFKKQFKKECRICGKKGHKGADCWDLPKNAHKRPGNKRSHKPEAANITGGYKGPPCDYCKMTNHSTDRCFKKQKDEKQKKKDNSERAEVLMICASKVDVEALLYAKSGQPSITKNTFIADSHNQINSGDV